MNWSRILEKFREELLRVPASPGTIVASNIAIPNRAFDCKGKKIWFELTCTPGDQFWITETNRESIALVNITICVPINSDYSRSNNLASRIVEHFIESNGFHKVITLQEETIYIDDVVQLPSMVINEIYKTGIRLDLTIR